ncbi:hypothetical protein [Nocardia sp. NPDC050793]|uniref:hypothetical protein n=1 Tax=Nocardia sp. NPDC050793 TaxID=3155159 RepID=UPI0033FF8C45
MPKKLTIQFGSELDPELYADIASTMWMLLRAMSRSEDFDFNVIHDGPTSLNGMLNKHWNQFAREAQWGDR